MRAGGQSDILIRWRAHIFQTANMPYSSPYDLVTSVFRDTIDDDLADCLSQILQTTTDLASLPKEFRAACDNVPSFEPMIDDCLAQWAKMSHIKCHSCPAAPTFYCAGCRDTLCDYSPLCPRCCVSVRDFDYEGANGPQIQSDKLCMWCSSTRARDELLEMATRDELVLLIKQTLHQTLIPTFVANYHKLQTLS